MSTWQLDDGENIWPLDVREMAEASLTIQSQAISELVLSKAAQCDLPAIESGTWCRLIHPSGTCVFAGEVILTQGQASPAERNVVRILDSWSDLERLTYRDGNNLRLALATAETDVVIIEGEPVQIVPSPWSLEASIRTVLERAIALGARLQIGTIDLDAEHTRLEFDATSCAAILVSLLRWSPGCTSWFDYSTTPPTLHICKADGLTPLTVPIEGTGGVTVTPQTDLQCPGVRLIYRKSIQNNWGTAEGIAVDVAGDPDARGGFVQALQLAPARVNYQVFRQRLRVAAVTPASGAWWQQFGVPPELGNPDIASTAVGNYVRAGQLQSWMLAEIDGEANPDPHGCTGPLAEDPGSPPAAGDAFADEAPDPPITNAQSFSMTAVTFGATWDALSPIAQHWSVRLPVTDALSGDYYRIVPGTWEKGERVPGGLAAALLAAVSRLAYSGTLTVQGENADPLVYRPGRALSISGSAWDAMSAPVQSCNHDLMRGASTLQFGPAAHLGAADLLELFRLRNPAKPASAEPEGDSEPEPVSYQATASSASGGPDDEEDEADEGDLTVSIEDPQDAAVPGAVFNIGGQNYPSGSTVSLPAGDYSIGFIVPPDYETPAPYSVTVVAEGSSSVFITAPFRDRIKFRSADGTNADTEHIDLNMTDIPSDAENKVIKLRLTQGENNGVAAECLVMRSDWWEAEEA